MLPILSKLFTAILRERIQYWADINDKMSEAQFGFRQGRTTDPLSIMNTAIQFYKERKSTLYTCFVDFAKAFDSVNHSLLWSKLARMGLSARLLKILQSMYVKSGGKRDVTNISLLERGETRL